MGKLLATLCVLLPLACALFGQGAGVNRLVIPNAIITIIGAETGAQQPLPDGVPLGPGSEYRTEPRPSGSGCRPEAMERVLIENREAELANREPKMEIPATRG
ncbi:MAG: hypothetical protein ACLQOO_22155 [Terriglobia bacterium]